MDTLNTLTDKQVKDLSKAIDRDSNTYYHTPLNKHEVQHQIIEPEFSMLVLPSIKDSKKDEN